MNVNGGVWDTKKFGKMKFGERESSRKIQKNSDSGPYRYHTVCSEKLTLSFNKRKLGDGRFYGVGKCRKKYVVEYCNIGEREQERESEREQESEREREKRRESERENRRE